MGSPEFPGDENDRQNQFQPPPSHALPMHGIVNSETEEEDSNDDAPIPAGGGGGGDGTTAEPTSFDPSQPYAAEGYHPLNFEIRTADDETDSADDEDGASSSSSNSIAAVAQAAEEPEEVSAEIETTAEREILSEIWNAPRPLESADIALDNDKAEQVEWVGWGELTAFWEINFLLILSLSDQIGHVESLAAIGRRSATAMGHRCPGIQVDRETARRCPQQRHDSQIEHSPLYEPQNYYVNPIQKIK